MGALSYRVWYFASLQYDQDQRNNEINARRQQVQILFAREQQAGAWFNPELLAIPLDTVRAWLDSNDELGRYRFAIESLFHEQEHVLDEQGERLMSFAGRFNSVPHDSYAALTTADMKFPEITLTGGERVTLSYGQYRALLETNRRQEDRAAAYRAFHQSFADNQNTYAALYNGVLQRDWFHARARGYPTTLDAALHGNNIPTLGGREPDHRHQGGRRPAPALSPAAAPRARRRDLSAVRFLAAAGAARRAVSVRRGGGLDRGFGVAARRRLSAAGPPCVPGELDRRLRKRRQAERRVFGAGVRRASVHAAQLQRDARRGVHAGARDGPLDAHAALARVAAVRLRRLHDLRRGGAVHAERGAVPRPDARARAVTRGARGAAAARHRQHRGHLLYPGAVCRFRAAGAPARRAGPAGDRRHLERAVRAAAAGILRRRASTRKSSRASPGRASRTSSTRRTTSTSTPPASRRPRA